MEKINYCSLWLNKRNRLKCYSSLYLIQFDSSDPFLITNLNYKSIFLSRRKLFNIVALTSTKTKHNPSYS